MRSVMPASATPVAIPVNAASKTRAIRSNAMGLGFEETAVWFMVGLGAVGLRCIEATEKGLPENAVGSIRRAILTIRGQPRRRIARGPAASRWAIFTG